MSFWEANRRLVIAVAAALIAAGVVHVVAASPRNGVAEDLETQNERMLLEIARLGRDGRNRSTVAEATAQLKVERGELGKVIAGLEKVLLAIPEDSRFRVPKGEMDPRLYFQKKLADLRRDRTEGRPYPASAPLGFTQEIQDKEKPDLLLERMAAVDRLARAISDAGLQRVNGIRHGEVRTSIVKGVRSEYLALLPMQVSAVTDERGLVAFLSAISGEENFLALDGLQVEVADPKARTFSMTASVSAILIRKGKVRVEDPVGPRPLPIGRY